MIRTTVFLVLASFLSTAHALPSDIDTSWGNNGHYTLTDRSVTMTALDTQGRLLITGSTATGAYIRRLQPNGQLDTSFGSNGTVELSLGSATRDTPVGLMVQSGDAILALINIDLIVGQADTRSYALVKLDVDGAFDTDFGTNGIRIDNGLAINFHQTSFSSLYVVLQDSSLAIRHYWRNGSLNSFFVSADTQTLQGNLKGKTGPMAGDKVDVYHDCYGSTCGLWKSNFPGNLTPVRSYLGSNSDNIFSRISTPSNSSDVQKISTVIAAPTELMAVDGGNYNIFILDRATIAAYPDGYIKADGYPTLMLSKFLASDLEDNSWNNSSSQRSDYKTGMQTGPYITVDPLGGLIVSSTNGEHRGTVIDYSLSADIFRLKGSSPDITPDGLGAAPISIYNSGISQYQSAPILITGLGEGVSVPARIIPFPSTSYSEGLKLSIDGGATWHNGWLWVKNNTELLVRHHGNNTLTVGGVLAPDNSALPLGNVLSVQFSGTNAFVTNPVTASIGGTISSSGRGSGGGGGALDIIGLLALGLLSAGRLRLIRQH